MSIASVLASERSWWVEQADCLAALRAMPDASVAACVTDPPAGIGFMGKAWDSFPLRDRMHTRLTGSGNKTAGNGFAQGVNFDTSQRGRAAFIAFLTPVLEEIWRVLLPGAHALVWAIPRTSHWTASAIEDAGFEVRDVITHVFGSGFPKSLQLGDGWGTALKPASEHWILARKPLRESTIARQFAATGTGGINVDGARVRGAKASGSGSLASWRRLEDRSDIPPALPSSPDLGRWPPNLAFSHSVECELVGTKRVVSGPSTYLAGTRTGGFGGTVGTPLGEQSVHYADADGLETVEDWRCVETCPIAELDRQSDGASRFFKTFSSSEDYDSSRYNGTGGSQREWTNRELGENFTKGDGIAAGENLETERFTNNSNIAGFGNKQMGLSPKVSRSTMPTSTKRTTKSKTLRWSRQSGMTTTTNDLESTTASSTASKNGDALGAASGSLSPSSPSGEPEPFMDTANLVPSSPSENGNTLTEKNTTPNEQPCVEQGVTGRAFPNFHYEAKASTSERSRGLESLPHHSAGEVTGGRADGSAGLQSPRAGAGRTSGSRNHHPTVKPIGLMLWLVTLIAPPGGTVLDPFCGSGTTGIAALRLGHRFIGIEQDAGYVELARQRIAEDMPLFNRSEVSQ